MANYKGTLTASNIKYLLVMQEIEVEGKGVRCVDVADAVGVTKPSVHTMMNNLKTMKLIKKNKYGVAYFTTVGRELAEKYSKYYDVLLKCFCGVFPDEVDIKTVICSVLSEVSEENLEIMRKRLSQDAESVQMADVPARPAAV